jgi:hypothetical protein
LWKQRRAGAIGTEEPVAEAAAIQFVLEHAHYRRREEIHLHGLGAQDESSGVPRAAGVHPGQVAEQALLAKGQFLAADPEGDRRLGAAIPARPDVE